jgi:uncharacterized peroxidase-related enzyme
MAFSPDTAVALNQLAETLLRAPNTLTPGERQLIATYVAYRNGCEFAHMIHGEVAAAHLGGDAELVESVKRDFRSAAISTKLKALLSLADQVVESGRSVTEDAIAAARAEGATDKEIHDAVLIAAAFCMYSRYVDGLATPDPVDADFYRSRGEWLAANGYLAADADHKQRMAATSG